MMDTVVPVDTNDGDNATDTEILPAQPLHIQTTAVTTTTTTTLLHSPSPPSRPPSDAADLLLSIPTNAISIGPSMTLSQLPIRPSTVQLLTQRGFETTSDVNDSLRFGLSNLAAELNRSNDLTTVAGIVRELNGCIHYARTGSFSNGGTPGSNKKKNTNDRAAGGGGGGEATISPYSSRNNIMTATELICPNKSASNNTDSTTTTSANGLVLRKHQNHIVTFCEDMDKLLGGGIHLGEVTEIAGLPGCGKTQLAMQLSVLARLPDSLGGVQGRTLYIDSEGSFTPERVWDMAEGLQIHIQRGIDRSRKRQEGHHHTNNSNGNDDGSENTKSRHNQRQSGSGSVTDKERDAKSFTVEEVLRSIQVFRVHDETALTTTIYSLPEYIDQIESSEDNHPQTHTDDGEEEEDDDDQYQYQYQHSTSESLPVRLIVIDSIAFQFRAVAPTDQSYYIQRTKVLTNLASFLADLAADYNLAVVVINQMTTKIISSSSSLNGTSKHGEMNNSISIGSGTTTTALVPALGESWAHSTATRLILSKSNTPTGSGMGSDNDDDDEQQQVWNGEDGRYQRNSLNLAAQTSTKQIRICELVKSAYRPNGSAKFVILPVGIRGVGKVNKGGTTSSSRRAQGAGMSGGSRSDGSGRDDHGRRMSGSRIPSRPPRQRDDNLGTETNGTHTGKRARYP